MNKYITESFNLPFISVPECHSKAVWLSLFCGTERKIRVRCEDFQVKYSLKYAFITFFMLDKIPLKRLDQLIHFYDHFLIYKNQDITIYSVSY